MAKKKDADPAAGSGLTEKQQERIRQSIELMAKTRPMNIDELLPYQRNQKDHPEEQVRNLANSLRRFGWRQPVVIDERNVIVIGHGRVLGAKMLGLTEVPVVSATDLTEDEIRELRIIDNKLNESAWNKYLDEDVQELNFEGFDSLDFDTLEMSEGNSDDEELPEEDNFDGTVPAETEIQKGDIYQLGRHRLMCGDSTCRKEIEALLDGNKIQLALTDPPYGINAVKVSGGYRDDRNRELAAEKREAAGSSGSSWNNRGGWSSPLQPGTIGGAAPTSFRKDRGGVKLNSGKEQDSAGGRCSCAYVSACEGRRKHRDGKSILGGLQRNNRSSDHLRWKLFHRFFDAQPVLGGMG